MSEPGEEAQRAVSATDGQDNGSRDHTRMA
jgi:hypothetical protein